MPNVKGPQKRLPEHPSEENLRKQAKQLAKRDDIQLAAAQFQLANEYGFRNWAELIEAVVGAHRMVPFLPLRGLIAFPHETYPIYIGRVTSIRAIETAAERKTPILMVAQRDAIVAKPSSADMYEVGTLASLSQWIKLGDGTIKAEIVGECRARVSRFVFDTDFIQAEYEEISESAERSPELAALMQSVVTAFDAYAVHETRIPLEMAKAINTAVASIGDPDALADKIAGHLNVSLAEKQALLEMVDPAQRLRTVLEHLEGYPMAKVVKGEK
ncbi:MAG TPA: LON peptidase substrate-binding domain-containing protein [Candidatus Binataceae bacterium]|nr:LON peptidase substrate-binding domain-containing protein [Candidatus Binataceae bacterium]